MLVAASATLSGCVVWNYVKGGYQDFTAYFNTYYNAQDAFDKGVKDVQSAMKDREISIISGSQPTPFVISGTAKQDFDLAIEKASKVLQYYPTSAYTQDCLFMIGISYYYEGDDLKGGRKFIEIESTFPHTDRYDEALLYQGGMLLRQRDYNRAFDTLSKALNVSRANRNWEIAARASETLSDYYLSQNDTLNAAAYLDTASTLSSGDNAAIYACEAGDMFSDLHQYKRAYLTYALGLSVARDIKLRFYSAYYVASVQRLQKRYYQALNTLADIRDDDKFYLYFPLIDYQAAQVLYDSGAVSSAVLTFTRIDTEFTSSEAATRAAFELGNTYLYQVGDFTTALKYFQRCASHPLVYGLSQKAQALAALLQEYLMDSYRAVIADSLYAHTVEAAEKGDSALAKSAVPIDTLFERTADAQQGLAGFFMFKLKLPDSAIVHYKMIVRHFKKSRAYPSALYTLGEHYFSEGDTAAARTYLGLLLAEDPESEYAAPASTMLGVNYVKDTDSSQSNYDSAIELVNKGSYHSAIRLLDTLALSSKSRFAAQSLYAIGWIYEHKLQAYDSAAVYYRLVVQKYPASDFSSEIRLALNGFDQARRDSAASHVIPNAPAVPTEQKPAVTDSSNAGFRMLQDRDRMLDSLKSVRRMSERPGLDSAATRRERIIR